MRLRPLFAGAPRLPMAVLGAFLLAHVALKALFFGSVFIRYSGVLYMASAGLISPVLLAGAAEWIVLVGLLAMGLGGLRPRHIGIDRASAVRALAALAALWAVVQGLAVAFGMLGGTVAWHTALAGFPRFHALGLQLEAVFGSGLIEEVLYRGVLLPQIYFVARARGLSATAALTVATLVTSVYFGLHHVPAALSMGLQGLEAAAYLVHVVLAGMLFAALYVRSGNLLVAAGVHALLNAPITLFQAPLDPALLVLVLACALMLGWPWLSRRFGALFEYGALEGKAAF